MLPAYPEQQQQQKQRSDTPKKDRRAVDPMAQKQKSSSSSSSLKRSLESISAPSLSMPGGSGSTVDPTDLLGLSKHPSVPSTVKRSLTGSEQVRQEDGTDFRESKVRKVEATSPSEALFSSSFDLSNTFDKEASDGFSMFSFGDPGSLLSQPLLSDSKPPPGISSNSNSKSGFPSTINGIETNPALVSSLLKESLQQDSKFGILSSSVTQSSEPPPMVSLPDAVNIKTEAPDMNAPATISSLLAPTALSTAPPVSLSATNSDVLQTLTGDPVTAIAGSKDSEDPHRIKTEKKKKKDKHKHKEKDKSKDKDREERKKHKKDKDRHRDKSDQGTASDASLVSPPAAPGPIKIKLPKDKLNLPSLGGSTDPEPGLKIKIPKDRLSGSASSLGGGNPPPSNQPAAVPLKLKISKDKIEHYNISSEGTSSNAASGSYNNGSSAASSSSSAAGPSGSSHGSHSHGSSSSKKKDRDKDREKSKSSKSGSSGSSGDYSKQNGGGGGGATGSSNKSSSSSSKVSDDMALFF